MEKNGKDIWLVVPLHNESEVIELSYKRMSDVMKGMNCKYSIVYIDDGSADDTWDKVQIIASIDQHVKGLRLSRNFGHQAAVSAGLEFASGDAVIVIDADLQDPPEIIPKMVDTWLDGYDIVYAKRLKRNGETLFKRISAFAYYRLLKMFASHPIPLDTGDFRLIDKKVCDVLVKMPEHNRFLRGMTAWAGFNCSYVEFVRAQRAAGKSNYTLKKMLRLATDGLLGFSERMLHLPLYFGMLVSFISVIALATVAILDKGVYAIMFSLMFLLIGGLFCTMGIIGAYISRITDEVRKRPHYILMDQININK